MTDTRQNGLRTVGTICAILMGIVFLVSGGWKVLMPFQTGEVLEQAKVPGGLGSLGAAVLGTLEVFTAILLFLPSCRKWGGLLSSALLVFFMSWIGVYYHALHGMDCSCFPIIKRTIGPGFFISDGVMLLMSIAAFAWSPGVRRFRIPAVAFASVAALALISFGVNAKERGAAQVPNPLIVDGKPENLNHGKVFIFFYDPSCEHCDAASRYMSTFQWKDTRVVAIPTVNPQWAESFLHDTHLKAGTSLELAKMRAAFKFVDPPFGAAVVDGQTKETFNQAEFDKPSPKPQLEKLGFVQ